MNCSIWELDRKTTKNFDLFKYVTKVVSTHVKLPIYFLPVLKNQKQIDTLCAVCSITTHSHTEKVNPCQTKNYDLIFLHDINNWYELWRLKNSRRQPQIMKLEKLNNQCSQFRWKKNLSTCVPTFEQNKKNTRYDISILGLFIEIFFV